MKQKIGNININMKMEDLEDLLDIVRGHEIWLECDERRVRVGEKAECKLGFGHNMRSERAVSVEKVKANLFNPEGEMRGLEVDVGVGEGHLIIPFTPKHEGNYTIAAEYDGGILDLPHSPSPKYYSQYAKTIVAVGGGQRSGKSVITGKELEITLNFKNQYRTGDKVALQVLYDGAALPDETVSAICGSCEDPIEMKTDSKGEATFELNQEGNWMIMVRHKDPEKGVEGLYDEKALTATFTVNCLAEAAKETK